MQVILNNIDKIITNQGTEVDLENIEASGADLGIQTSVAAGVTEYVFSATPVGTVTSVDTSGLSPGSTLIWDGSAWQASDLIIETI